MWQSSKSPRRLKGYGQAQPRSLHAGRAQATERQGRKANEAVIMLETIMALLRELLRQLPKEVINHREERLRCL
jgi:hypothetical protein